MPRSFLVKKHHSSKKPKHGGLSSNAEEASCGTHKDVLLHNDIPPHHHCPALSPHLQPRALSLSSSSSSSSFCPPSPSVDRLYRPTSPNTSPLSLLGHPSEAYSRGPAEANRPAESLARASLEIQRVARDHGGGDGLLPPSLPLLALFPAIPPAGTGGQESFECLDCHKEHLSVSGLSEHKQLRCEWSSKRCFSCKYCEKEYVSLGALKMHIRTHTLPCVCKLCGKAFSRPWLLQGHIRTHTGEKPFSCLHCSRAFADRSNLRAHLQTHSEVKRYQCAGCFKTFSRISLLAKHQKAGCLLS